MAGPGPTQQYLLSEAVQNVTGRVLKVKITIDDLKVAGTVAKDIGSQNAIQQAGKRFGKDFNESLDSLKEAERARQLQRAKQGEAPAGEGAPGAGRRPAPAGAAPAAPGEPGEEAPEGEPGEEAPEGEPGEEAPEGEPGEEAPEGEPGEEAPEGEPGEAPEPGEMPEELGELPKEMQPEGGMPGAEEEAPDVGEVPEVSRIPEGGMPGAGIAEGPEAEAEEERPAGEGVAPEEEPGRAAELEKEKKKAADEKKEEGEGGEGGLPGIGGGEGGEEGGGLEDLVGGAAGGAKSAIPGSRMFLWDTFISVWEDFTFSSLVYIHLHFIGNKLLPDIPFLGMLESFGIPVIDGFEDPDILQTALFILILILEFLICLQFILMFLIIAMIFYSVYSLLTLDFDSITMFYDVLKNIPVARIIFDLLK
ncbi:MAG: hypothetical protein ABIG66_02590 [Candidatus Kerfeldbacteria bacterium]